MKFFAKFSAFFVLFASSALAFGYFVLAIVRLVDYFGCSIETLKNVYLNACGSHLASAIIVLIIGFALSSVVYLLRNIAYKNEENKEIEM